MRWVGLMMISSSTGSAKESGVSSEGEGPLTLWSNDGARKSSFGCDLSNLINATNFSALKV